MWLVDAVRRGSGSHILHLVVGARVVEAGVFDGAQFEAIARVEFSANGADLSGLAVAVSDAIASLGEIAKEQRVPCPCRVIVSDFWLYATELPWSGRLAGSAESVNANIREQFETTGWDVTDADCIRSDDAGALQPRLAMLYPAALLAAIRNAAKSHGLALESIRPLSTLALKLAQASRPDALAILEDEVSIFVAVRAGRLADLSIAVTAKPCAEALVAWRRHRLLASTSAAASTLAVLDLSGHPAPESLGSDVQNLTAPTAIDAAGKPVNAMLAFALGNSKHRRHPLDAVQPSPRRTILHLVTALALLGMVFGAVQARQSTAQLAELQSEALAAVPVPPPRAPALTKAENAQWQRVQEITREINAPIGSLMATLKSPADIDVQVVSTDVDAAVVGSTDSARPITVQAESHQALDMQRYVDYLANRPSLVSATLVRHDLTDGNAGSIYRFTVEATWRP